MIVTLGVENLVVINTKGAVLIADKDKCELIKKIQQSLAKFSLLKIL